MIVTQRIAKVNKDIIEEAEMNVFPCCRDPSLPPWRPVPVAQLGKGRLI